MAQIAMSLDGFDATQRALKATPELVKLHSADAINASARAVVARARAIVPVNTGALRSAIDYSMARTGLSARVGLTASDFEDLYYWRFVEFGTRFQPARPFFRPAAEAESETFIQRMRQIWPKIERDLAGGRFA